VLCCHWLSPQHIEGVDFLRGDVNGDGQVGISDAFGIQSYIFADAPPIKGPDCLEAFDVNDTGDVDIVDIAHMLSFLHGFPFGEIPAPFPLEGPDPRAGQAATLPCDDYGGPSPLEDAQARLSVLSASVEGGELATSRIVLAVSCSYSIAAVFGHIRFPAGLLDSGNERVIVHRIDRLPGPDNEGSGHVTGDVLRFAYMLSSIDSDPLPPGDPRPVLELFPCIRPGVPPGEYPLVIEMAELTDHDSGRAIHPATVGAPLSILERVTDPAECAPPVVDPASWGRPFPRRPAVLLEVGDAVVPEGQKVGVPLQIDANGDLRAFSFSLDFDEERLRVEEIVESLFFPDDVFRVFDFDNGSLAPGNGGVDEGYIAGAVVLPVEAPHFLQGEVLRIHFEIVSDEPDFTTSITFLDGAPGAWSGAWTSIRNEIVVSARRYRPGGEAFRVESGTVRAARSEAPFLRGDTNSDGRVDLSDAVMTLGHLFLGLPAPVCLDAADADDDAVVNVTDAIYTLLYLFSGGPPPPPPHPAPGLDPTVDGMQCRRLGPGG